MDGERLIERRKWFRVFPEGTLEFTIVTRVLALVLLISLAVVGSAQRPLALAALAFILWVDYALLMWWMIQVATDLLLVCGKLPDDTPSYRMPLGLRVVLPSVAFSLMVIPWVDLLTILGLGAKANYFRFVPVVGVVLFLLFLVPAYRSSSYRVRLGFKIILPSVAVLLAVTPWVDLLTILGFGSMTTVLGVGVKTQYFIAPIAGVVLFLLFFVPAYKSLLRIGVNSPIWASVLLIPIFHWFALHRVAAVMDRRIDHQLRARGFEKLSHRPRLAIGMADITWLLGVVPWLVVLIFVLLRGWPMGGAFRGGVVCSTILTALFT
ncbi:MAG: hypothetical protein FWC56_06030, partial [Phycisphaerae bacterium]|nr:hypothetical protein [Phycisphaerae bacterium]